MRPRSREIRAQFRPLAEKTLNQVEGRSDEEVAASGIKDPVRLARRTPIGRLSANRLMWLFVHGRSLTYLFPRAVKVVEADPWCSAEYYESDLLHEVFTTDPAVWPSGVDWLPRLRGLAEKALGSIPDHFALEMTVDIEAALRDWLATKRLCLS